MKLQISTTEAILTNVGQQGSFSIKNSAHAFKILSSGLYSNKIKAIVRELSCNAIDSHTEAGVLDIPFEVHLPNQLEPYFSVRDYGTGLDNREVTEIYTTYFESTKQDSNDFIGALGLGSKSPFSYTDNFTITAIKDGVQRIYSAFINDEGCPGIVQMSESETDLRNGVSVQFPVSSTHDINRYCNEAEEIFKWFKYKPLVIGNSSYQDKEVKYSHENIVQNVHVRDAGYNRGPIAIQGNIAYPVNLPLSDEYTDISRLLKIPLVLEFDIGDLDISASREELSYIPATIENILKKLREVNSALLQYVKLDIDKIEDEWEKAYAIFKYENEALFAFAAREYVKASGCKMLSLGSSGISREMMFSESALAKKGIKLSIFKVSYSYVASSFVASKVKTSYFGTDETDMHCVPIAKNAVFVTNDTARGGQNRCKSHFRAKGEGSTVILIELVSREFQPSAIADFLKEIHDPDVIEFKDLAAPAAVERFGLGFSLFTYVNTSRNWWRDEYSWKWKKLTSDLEHDTNETYYYIPLNGYDALDENDEIIHELGTVIWPKVLSLGAMDKSVPIYGVRKTKIKSIREADNWVNALDVVKDYLSKFDQSNIEKYICKAHCKSKEYIVYSDTINMKTDSLSDGSPFRKFADKVRESKAFGNDKSDGKSELFTYLAKWANLSCTVDISKVKSVLEQEYNEMLKEYPMLVCVDDYITDSMAEHIIEYVRMMDKKEKEND